MEEVEDVGGVGVGGRGETGVGCGRGRGAVDGAVGGEGDGGEVWVEEVGVEGEIEGVQPGWGGGGGGEVERGVRVPESEGAGEGFYNL